MRYFLAYLNRPFSSNVSCKVTTLCLKIPFYMGAVPILDFDFTELNFLFDLLYQYKVYIQSMKQSTKWILQSWMHQKQIPRQKTITTNRTSINSIYLEGKLHWFGQVYFYFIFDARMKGTMWSTLFITVHYSKTTCCDRLRSTSIDADFNLVIITCIDYWHWSFARRLHFWICDKKSYVVTRTSS